MQKFVLPIYLWNVGFSMEFFIGLYYQPEINFGHKNRTSQG